MATRPGNYLAVVAEFASASERHDIQHNGVILIAGQPVLIFVMEARDSVTGATYYWQSTTGPDWAGTGYPGPNSPTTIAVSQQRLVVG